MRYPRLILALILLSPGCAARPDAGATSRNPSATATTPARAPAPAARKLNFVIVHGAWGGGWAFREVDRLLTARGHAVHRATLTGQGERVHLASRDVGLATHVDDVVNAILFEDLRDVVLVGHSYGGMVITGVIDRVPERISRAVYLDAIVPEDGESADAVMQRGDDPGDAGDAGDARPTTAPADTRPTDTRPADTRPADTRAATRPRGRGRRPVTNGFIVPEWVKPGTPPPHDVPQSAKTFSDPIRLRNPQRGRSVPTTYILTVDPGQAASADNFFRSYQRARARGWTTEVMPADHNPQWSNPQDLARRLEAAGAGSDEDRIPLR